MCVDEVYDVKQHCARGESHLLRKSFVGYNTEREREELAASYIRSKRKSEGLWPLTPHRRRHPIPKGSMNAGGEQALCVYTHASLTVTLFR